MFVAIHFAWRWASRRWSLPCPTFLAWSLESPLFQRLSGTETTLNRIGFRPGQKILEIGPGPGRLLLPAAQRILPGGEAVGIDIQPGMIERLEVRAKKAGITNLMAILSDATEPLVPEASFDLVFLCTVLGEIPDRAAALSQCHRALKAGGQVLGHHPLLPLGYQRLEKGLPPAHHPLREADAGLREALDQFLQRPAPHPDP
jgi:ubiquinone/menaquinone biosynthesis C-methylase UbiE